MNHEGLNFIIHPWFGYGINPPAYLLFGGRTYAVCRHLVADANTAMAKFHLPGGFHVVRRFFRVSHLWRLLSLNCVYSSHLHAIIIAQL